MEDIDYYKSSIENLKIRFNNQAVCGVYKITNTINNKIYIGSAVNIKRRWHYYKWAYNTKYLKSQRLLCRAFLKYKIEKFKFEVLEQISNVNDKKELKIKLLNLEQKYMNFYNSYDKKIGYNICKNAGNCLGLKRSKRLRNQQSIRMLGSNNPFYGKKHPKEIIELIRIKNIGRKKIVSENTKKNLSKALIGHIHSKETKQKIGMSNSKTFYFIKDDNILLKIINMRQYVYNLKINKPESLNVRLIDMYNGKRKNIMDGFRKATTEEINNIELAYQTTIEPEVSCFIS